MDSEKKTDFNYILSHSNQSNYEIPYFYDMQQWKIGETYRIRVSHIYDPSKFWIVLKDRELNVLQGFIKKFYAKHANQYKIPLSSLCRNMYCVAFSDDNFYRGLIVNIPLKSTLEGKASVFLFDFGYMAVVSLDKLCYLHEKLFNIPRFSIRASLSHIQPYDKCIWDYNAVKRFNELVTNKVLLSVLYCTQPTRRIVELTIGDVRELSCVADIGDILLNEKLAQSVFNKTNLEKNEKSKSRYLPKTKYPYLFPSFEAIESGMVAPCVYTSEKLWQCIARDVLFRPYFTYTGGITDNG